MGDSQAGIVMRQMRRKARKAPYYLPEAHEEKLIEFLKNPKSNLFTKTGVEIGKARYRMNVRVSGQNLNGEMRCTSGGKEKLRETINGLEAERRISSPLAAFVRDVFLPNLKEDPITARDLKAGLIDVLASLTKTSSGN